MKYLIGIFLVFLVYVLTAQPADVRAKAAYLKAQELYGSGDYPGAIVKLDQVKELLGSTNPRVEYLLAQCHFQTKNIEKTDAAIAAYFKLAVDSDPNYMDMLQMIEEVDERRDEYNLIFAKSEQENAAWQEAKSRNTREVYTQFVQKYPNGKYATEAKKNIIGVPGEPLTDQRTGRIYETVWIGNQLWMTQDLLFKTSGSFTPKKDDYTIYSLKTIFIDRTVICPTGWHLPTSDEILDLLRMIGVNQPIFLEPHSDALTTGTSNKISNSKDIIASILSISSGIDGATNSTKLNFTSNGLCLADGILAFSSFINESSVIEIYRINEILQPKVYSFPSYRCRCIKD